MWHGGASHDYNSDNNLHINMYSNHIKIVLYQINMLYTINLVLYVKYIQLKINKFIFPFQINILCCPLSLNGTFLPHLASHFTRK